MIRILSVDDHDLVRKGIAAILSTEADLELVAAASCGREAIALFRQHKPDVTLMDLRLTDMSGSQVTTAIRQEFPEARIIALTSYDGDQDIYRALEAGVRGYLLKEMVHTEVVKAIRVVHDGQAIYSGGSGTTTDWLFPRCGADSERGGSVESGGARVGQQGSGRCIRNRAGDDQSACAKHLEQAGCERQNTRCDHRAAARYYSPGLDSYAVTGASSGTPASLRFLRNGIMERNSAPTFSMG